MAGFEKMFEWIQTFGKILAVYFYLPSSQSINDDLWHELWAKYHTSFSFFEAIYCPKKRDEEGKRTDDVDDHLIAHTEQVITLLGDRVRFLCLVSGDIDYSPFLWRLKREKGIEIAFVSGGADSFSPAYRQMKIAGEHPVTGEEMIYCFSPQK